jgi:hypothetical protein
MSHGNTPCIHCANRRHEPVKNQGIALCIKPLRLASAGCEHALSLKLKPLKSGRTAVQSYGIIAQSTEMGMPLLRRPLYQRTEGADEDRWRLAFDTDTNRLFVEHEKQRGDMRGSGYSTDTDEIDVAAFLNERGQGQQQGQHQSQHELMQLLRTLFEDRKDAPHP